VKDREREREREGEIEREIQREIPKNVSQKRYARLRVNASSPSISVGLTNT